LFAVIQLFSFAEAASISWIALLWVTSLVAVGGFRIGWMVSKESNRASLSRQNKALIIGAGDAGTMVANQLLKSDKLDVSPVGFIDDDPHKMRLEILGLPVLGSRSDIPLAVKSYDITDVIIAIPSAPKEQIGKIVDICKETSVRIKILPRVQDLIFGRIQVNDIRDIDVKDLLGRDMIRHFTPEVQSYLQNKVVLVTGAGGSIGSELVLQAAQFHPQTIILVGHGENSIFTTDITLRERFPDISAKCVIADIQDRKSMEDVFRRYKPHVVFHAAAHKHVPLMEQNEAAAVRNNVFGTKIVAETAAKYDAERFVFISTDKAVHPVNIMGMTKRIGELMIQHLAKTSGTRFSAVRFGNVLESRGSVIPIFKKQIAAGGPITVTHPDMVRFFMTIPEAVQLVLEAGALSEGGEIFVLDMGEPVKISDLAKTLIQLSGYQPDRDIKIVYTGIRPGEKLNEALFYEDERVTASKHPHISIALPKPTNSLKLQQDILELEVALFYNDERIRQVLERILQP
jgi:FlaA1/EpsC-like NDP-sugar epimerase